MCALKYASEALAMICICDKRCQARMMRDDNAREWATACRCACLAEKQSRMLVNRRVDLTIHTHANMSKQDQKTSIRADLRSALIRLPPRWVSHACHTPGRSENNQNGSATSV
jgi:hypothetical protein